MTFKLNCSKNGINRKIGVENLVDVFFVIAEQRTHTHGVAGVQTNFISLKIASAKA